MTANRFISILLCLTLLFSTVPLNVSAVDSDAVSLSNVYSGENYAVYSHKDANCYYNIFLNTITATGSFAIVYCNAPDFMYEYCFTLALDSINITSLDFWSNLVSFCFNTDSEWRSVYLPGLIAVNDTSNGATTYTITDSTIKNGFRNWLISKYGSQRTNSYVKGTTKNGITFLQYETVEYSVIKNNTYVVTQGISVAGFIATFLTYAINPTLSGVIGLFTTTATGMIAAGTSIDEYSLNVYWCKYVTAKNGTKKLSYAEKYINYIGYASNELEEYGVDTSSAYITYNPSSSLFESDDAQFTEAYNNYMN